MNNGFLVGSFLSNNLGCKAKFGLGILFFLLVFLCVISYLEKRGEKE